MYLGYEVRIQVRRKCHSLCEQGATNSLHAGNAFKPLEFRIYCSTDLLHHGWVPLVMQNKQPFEHLALWALKKTAVAGDHPLHERRCPVLDVLTLGIFVGVGISLQRVCPMAVLEPPDARAAPNMGRRTVEGHHRKLMVFLEVSQEERGKVMVVALAFCVHKEERCQVIACLGDGGHLRLFYVIDEALERASREDLLAAALVLLIDELA